MPLAAVIALLLFLLMAQLADSGRIPGSPAAVPVVLELSRLRIDTQVHHRERERPPEPEEVVPQPQMPQPRIDTQLSASSEVPRIELQVPEIQSNLSFNITPQLSDISQSMEVSAPALVAVDVAPLVRISPQYPRRALNRRVEGHVLVEFEINAQGHVTPGSFVIIESEPPGVFDKTVRRALLRWRFQPDPGGAYRARQRMEFKLES